MHSYDGYLYDVGSGIDEIEADQEMSYESENIDRISKLQYDNLRKHFNSMVTEVLGRKYYNMGMDVYTCDKLTCEDIVHKVKDLKKQCSRWRLWTFIWVIFAGLSFGLLVNFLTL